MLPKDPIMLLSYINTQLRDVYDSYEKLCDDLDLDGKKIEDQLRTIGYEYQSEINQFR